MKKVFAVTAALALLGLSIAAQAVTIDTVTVGDAGNQFAEDFEDPAKVDADWSPWGSAFSVSGGVGTLLPDGSVAPIWWNHGATVHDKGTDPILFGDLVYAVDVKLPQSLRTGLCFGSDSGNRRFWVVYDIGSAMLSANNDVENAWTDGGTWSLLEDYRPYDGQWHRWRVEVRNSQFDFYVDTHHVITAQLDGYLPGPIGMRSWDGGGAQFDNLIAIGAVPEPSSLLALICGLGGLGAAWRRRR